MAKECSEIGTIKMGNHDGRVKQYPLSALAQEKIIHLIFRTRWYVDERPNGGKNLTTNTDITIRDHRDAA